jgi:hypothetical protein
VGVYWTAIKGLVWHVRAQRNAAAVTEFQKLASVGLNSNAQVLSSDLRAYIRSKLNIRYASQKIAGRPS